jgi:hypothetical protein
LRNLHRIPEILQRAHREYEQIAALRCFLWVSELGSGAAR